MDDEQKSRLIATAAWLWLVGALAAYLVQFSDLVGPILAVLR